MAEPIDFKESNFTFTKPEGMSDEECSSLPCFVVENQNRVISCWELTPAEIKEIVRTGVVWADVYSFPTPPIAITGLKPFGIKECCPQCGSWEWGQFEIDGDSFCECGYAFPGGEMK